MIPLQHQQFLRLTQLSITLHPHIRRRVRVPTIHHHQHRRWRDMPQTRRWRVVGAEFLEAAERDLVLPA